MLSEQDCSAYYYAAKQEAILLTGDQRLKKLALANDISAYGILWVFDQMVACECLSKKEATEAMKLLLLKNKRIPVDECEARIKQWEDGK